MVSVQLIQSSKFAKQQGTRAYRLLVHRVYQIQRWNTLNAAVARDKRAMTQRVAIAAA